MNTYNKKNWYKKIFIVFVLFLLNVPTLNADTIVFRYNVISPIIKTIGDFKTQTECESNRTSYVQQNIGYVTEMCKPVTTAGEPVIGVEAQKELGEISGDYDLLAPIPGLEGTVKTNNIGQYFNLIFKFAIALAGALAVIMIIMGGIQYMGDESIFGKTEGKKKIFSAIFGLLIALGSWAILNTIDPNLLGKKGLSVDQVSIEIVGDANSPVTVGGAGTANLAALGIKCDKTGGFSEVTSVARSFKNKMTYSQFIPKGQNGPNNTVKYDCSGFVNAALQCSGINTSALGINSGTSVIFSSTKSEKANSITSTKINDEELKVGDLIGWKPSDDKNGNGHVMIYIGNGMVADSHGPENKVGEAYGEFSVLKYKDRIKYVVRLQ